MKEVMKDEALWERARQEVFSNKKEKYEVEITETLQRCVVIEATSEEEAKALVEAAYHKEKIILDADNSNVYVEFSHGLYDEETMSENAYLKCNDDGQFEWVFN